jgi:hypothetical protein
MQLFSLSGQKIDALWQFFVSIHIAIYGALFVFHRIKVHQIVVSVILYIAFSIVNIRAKANEYELYEALLNEIKDNNIKGNIHLNSFISNYSVDDRIMITIIIHIVSFVFLIYLLGMARNS